MPTPISTTRAHAEIIDLIALGTTPEDINFPPCDLVKKRVANLIVPEKDGALSEDEKIELEHYMMLKHLLRLAKARAYQYILHSKLMHGSPLH